MNIRTLFALALLPVLVFAAAPGAHAQGLNPEWFGVGADPAAGGQWKECIEQAMNAAGVTASQRAQIESIRQQLAADVRAVWNDQSLPRDQKHIKIRNLRAEAFLAIQNTLTARQRETIRTWMSQNCPRPRPRPMPGPAPRVECLMQALDAIGASAGQKAQVAAIQEKLRADLEALRNDPSLTPDERRQKARELTSAAMKAVQDVLTADQWAAARDWMRENCRPRRPAPPSAGERPAGAGRGPRAGGPPSR